ncbi:MAG: hypothetical protein HYS13_25310 [Planctomycetia bacterium]|nr:hypothetical protein [Planctomycetia bacterium]
MEARLARVVVVVLSLLVLGGRYQSANFTVDAPTPELAEEIGKAAEKYRVDLAQVWLGKTLPRWSKPCPITAKVAPTLGAGGVTTFVFDQGEVFGWNMTVQGTRERVLDSVLPHEISHTIFASHFRQPLPRWADEGACTTVEHSTERARQNQMLIDFLQTNRGIPFSVMFRLKEYPQDMLPLYSQGHSLATFLIEQGGRQKFMKYVAEGLENGDWADATKTHYGFAGLGQLQGSWLDWVRQGSPPLSPKDNDRQDDVLIAKTSAASTGKRPRPEPNLLYRAQSDDGARLVPSPKMVPVKIDPVRPGAEAADAKNQPPVRAPSTGATASQPRSFAPPRTDSLARSAAGTSKSNFPEKDFPDEGWHQPGQAPPPTAARTRGESQAAGAMPPIAAQGNELPRGPLSTSPAAAGPQPTPSTRPMIIQWRRPARDNSKDGAAPQTASRAAPSSGKTSGNSSSREEPVLFDGKTGVIRR